MQDRALLKQLKKDPEREMALLIEEYAGLVYAVVKGKLNGDLFCASDVEECVADTFSEFYLDLDKYDPSLGSLKAWLSVMARHNALDLMRRRLREGLSFPLDEGISDEEGMEDAFFESELREELVKEIKALGEPDCEILIRKFYFSESSKEIAEKLNITISNVDTRTHRAIRKLREKMGGDKT